jgi:vacuolar-type H+-ATPase subunit E/Vma4
VLTEEIIADAKRQAERTVSHARQEAQQLAAKGKADAEKENRDSLAAGKAAAQRRRDLILATVPIEVSRKRAATVEALLTAIHDEARDRILKRQGVDYRQLLASQAAEAIGRMEGDAFVLQLSDADLKAFGAGLAEDVQRRVGKSNVQVKLAPEAVKIPGGVIVRDAAGRQLWDNSLEARLERFWPILRREIGVRTSLASAGVAESSKGATSKES